jgi:hypothetical protein
LIEDSYLARFFAKFIEIVAVGFATACSAYLVAHLVGPLPASTPPAPVSVGSAAATAVEVAKSPPAQPAPPVAAAAVDEPAPAPQPATDAPSAPPARKAARAATSVPPVGAPKDFKTGTGVARGEKSAEALARAALANLDADRPAPPDAPIRKVAPAPAAVEVQPRQAVMPPPAAVEAPPGRVAAVDPLPPPPSSAPEIVAPSPKPRADEGGLFSLPKRMLGQLRPGTPSLAGEAPRPPLPVAVGPAPRD